MKLRHNVDLDMAYYLNLAVLYALSPFILNSLFFRLSSRVNLRFLCCLNEKQTKILSASILVGTYHSGRFPFRQFNSGNFSSEVNGLCLVLLQNSWKIRFS